MSETKQIKTALVSVYHKDGLEDMLALLAASGVSFISTGGTREFIESLGYPCAAIEDLTGYPPMLGGRVKTLHPKVFGAILSRRDDVDHQQDVMRFGIPDINMVVVDLYPFVETVASGASEAEIIEKIDIGGISLIRAAAKNFRDVVIVPSKHQYAEVCDILRTQGAETTLDQRRKLATAAFGVSSAYDSAIFSYFNGLQPESQGLRLAIDGSRSLRYGENPHQKGCFCGRLDEIFEQLHGKELSYNNLLDIDAAVNLIAEFGNEKPAMAVLKHNNPCGFAVRETVAEAWRDALAGDPLSAFGGVIISNTAIDAAAAEEINKIFFEVLIAPGFDAEAIKVLESKKNRILLRLKKMPQQEMAVRTCLNGALVQERDRRVATDEEFTPMTERRPDARQTADLHVAERLVKHCKSNAIVLVNNAQLVGAGVGQTSRVDAAAQAIAKARTFNLPIDGAVMGSDAFFPFPDSVELAYNAGVRAIVQPGGSLRDNESVEFCNAHDIAMVKTGLRHFRH